MTTPVGTVHVFADPPISAPMITVPHRNRNAQSITCYLRKSRLIGTTRRAGRTRAGSFDSALRLAEDCIYQHSSRFGPAPGPCSTSPRTRGDAAFWLIGAPRAILFHVPPKTVGHRAIG
ncbi:hypothetical protein D8S82_11940 [Mycobacterium hodleri]|uniref:Uncharacterized protein n=1 Tax=Mycolicibacterium hodleri TaxID=49897 RepID=A0A544W213_9MYCO|nr:hypothetical protein D8S82_11940 [Mycolicibacterium hodleri]